jgi:uncharacterized repeat protein (TIGR01451 family)
MIRKILAVVALTAVVGAMGSIISVGIDTPTAAADVGVDCSEPANHQQPECTADICDDPGMENDWSCTPDICDDPGMENDWSCTPDICDDPGMENDWSCTPDICDDPGMENDWSCTPDICDDPGMENDPSCSTDPCDLAPTPECLQRSFTVNVTMAQYGGYWTALVLDSDDTNDLGDLAINGHGETTASSNLQTGQGNPLSYTITLDDYGQDPWYSGDVEIDCGDGITSTIEGIEISVSFVLTTDVTCDITYTADLATITVNKTLTDLTGGTFEFTAKPTVLNDAAANAHNANAPIDSDSVTISAPDTAASTTLDIEGGYIYTFAELDQPGIFSEITCERSSSNGPVDMPLEAVVLNPAGEATCDVVNSAGAELHLEVTNGSVAVFDSSMPAVEFDLGADTSVSLAAGEQAERSIPTGSRTITIASADGWADFVLCTLTDAGGERTSTTSGWQLSDVTFDLAQGQTVDCAVTRYPIPKLTINKTLTDQEDLVVGFSQLDNWLNLIFEDGSTNEAGDLALTIPADSEPSAVEFIISESVPRGWAISDLDCDTAETSVEFATIDDNDFAVSVDLTTLPDDAPITCNVTNGRRVTVDKSVEDVGLHSDETHSIAYELVVTNPLDEEVEVSLFDTFDFGSAVEVVGLLGVAAYDDDGEQLILSDTDFTGVAPETLVQTFTVGALAQVTFEITVEVRITPGHEPEECDDESALNNVAKLTYEVELSGEGDETMAVTSMDNACEPLAPSDFEIRKTVVGDARYDDTTETWFVDYLVDIENEADGVSVGEYDLFDTPDFGEEMGIQNIKVFYLDGIDDDVADVEGDEWPLQIATDRIILGGDAHEYRVEIEFTLDPAAWVNAIMSDNDSEFDTLTCNNEALVGSGLLNRSMAVLGTGEEAETITASDCTDAPFPHTELTKEVVDYTYVDNDTVTVEYELSITNPTALDALYLIYDVPLFGDGVTTTPATVTGATGATLVEVGDGLLGLGVDTYTVQPQPPVLGIVGIAGGGKNHAFTIAVTYDVDTTNGFNGTCAAPTSLMSVATGGLGNLAVNLLELLVANGGFQPLGGGDSDATVGFDDEEDPLGGVVAHACMNIGAVTVDKEVSNDDGGNMDADDFSFTLYSGPETAERSLDAGITYVVATGEYDLVEDHADGYVPGELTCTTYDTLPVSEGDTSDETEDLGGPSIESVVDDGDETPVIPGQTALDIGDSEGHSCLIRNDDKYVDISVSKSAEAAVAVAGDTHFTFTIEVSNEGDRDLDAGEDVELRDVLPAGMTWVSLTGCTDVTIVGQDATCTIDAQQLEINEAVTITATVAIDHGAQVGDVSNQVTVTTADDPVPSKPSCFVASKTVTSDEPGDADADPLNNTACATVTIERDVDVKVSKSDGGVTAIAGQTTPVAYTIIVSNVGTTNAAAADNVIVTDTLPAGWAWVSLTGCDNVTIAALTATCDIAASTMTAGGQKVLTATAKPVATAASGVATNIVTVGNTEDPAPVAPTCSMKGNNVACESTPVTRAASLTASKTSDANGAVSPGSTVNFTLTVTNNGPSTLLSPGTKLVDDLPIGLEFVAASGTNWTCTTADPVVCDYTGTLSPGDTASVVVTTKIAATAVGTLTNTGTFTAVVDVEDDADTSSTDGRGEALVVTATATASAEATVVIAALPPPPSTTTTTTTTVAGAGGDIPETGAGSSDTASAAVVIALLGLLLVLGSQRRRRTV